MINNGEAVRGTLNATTTAAMPAADFKYFLPEDTEIITKALLDEIAEQAKAAAGSVGGRIGYERQSAGWYVGYFLRTGGR